MSCSISANPFLSVSRRTGTTRPFSVPTATPISKKWFWITSVPSIRPLMDGTSLSA